MNDQSDQSDQPEDEPDAPHMFVMTPGGPMSLPAFRDMQDRMHASFEASAHQGVQFFEGLTEEQLLTFRGILNALSSDPDIIPYYSGMTSAYLRWRFNICPACSNKHDEELHKIIEKETGGAAVAPTDTEGQHETDDEELRENARIWNVKFADIDNQERPLHLTPVVCANNCGATFSNLADRMLRKPGPDGCPGCIQRMKTG